MLGRGWPFGPQATSADIAKPTRVELVSIGAHNECGGVGSRGDALDGSRQTSSSTSKSWSSKQARIAHRWQRFHAPTRFASTGPSGIGSTETPSMPKTSGKKCRRERQRARRAVDHRNYLMSSNWSLRLERAHHRGQGSNSSGQRIRLRDDPVDHFARRAAEDGMATGWHRQSHSKTRSTLCRPGAARTHAACRSCHCRYAGRASRLAKNVGTGHFLAGPRLSARRLRDSGLDHLCLLECKGDRETHPTGGDFPRFHVPLAKRLKSRLCDAPATSDSAPFDFPSGKCDAR